MSYLQDEPYHVDIEIENPQCKCSMMLRNSGISQFNVIDVRGVDKGLTRHLISIPSKQREKIPADVTVTVEREDKDGRNTLICFESDGCDVCNTVISQGSFLLSGSNVEDSKFVYSFIAPNYDVFMSIITQLEEGGFKPKVLTTERFSLTGGVVTKKQEKVLWIALKMGFFEFPRKIHMRELSEKLARARHSIKFLALLILLNGEESFARDIQP